MDVLQDEVVASELDHLLHDASPRVDKILQRLHHLGWKPKGDTPTTIFSQALFVDNYVIVRMNDEIAIPDAIAIAYGQTLNHPVMTKWLAKRGVQILDKAAGVKE